LSQALAGKRVCLLTGGPGVGKTTVIKRALDRTSILAGGFFSEEIRSAGVRQGFSVVTLDGQSAILSHVDIKGPYRVGKYGVDVEALERVGVAAIRESIQRCELVVIDEIGKMELLSSSFKEAVEEAINGGKRVLGTIMLASHPWADRVKRHPDVTTVAVTRSNRDSVLEQVVWWIEEP